MGKFKKLIKISKIIISNPKVLGCILMHDNPPDKYVKNKFKISELRTVDLLDLFPNFDTEVFPYSGASHSSTPLDYALLRKFAENIPHCRYFEIGTWLGESIANVASIAEECVSLSLSDQEMKKMGETQDRIQVHRFFSKDKKNIQHILGNSQKFNFDTLGKFDLIFIDGDHNIKAVENDTKNAFKLLKDENSVIVWHDYSGLSTDLINYDVLSGILDGCNEEQRSHLYHISNTKCAIYIRKNLKVSNEKNIFLPMKNFKIKISAIPLHGEQNN